MLWMIVIAVTAVVLGSVGQVALRAARSREVRRPGQLRKWAQVAIGIAAVVILVRFGLPWLAVVGSALFAASKWLMHLLPFARLLASWKRNAQQQPTGNTPQRGRLTRSEALAILGLPADASQEQITHAYKSLMLKVHPDHGGSAALASQLNDAYRALKH